LKEISDDITELVLSNNRYAILSKVTYDQMVPLIPSPDMIEYRFVSPWLGLNQENYRKWMGMHEWKERKRFECDSHRKPAQHGQGLGVVIEHRLNVHSHLEKVETHYKGVEMTGFTGSFRVNMQIPEYIGIGREYHRVLG